MHNFTFNGGRKRATTNFSFSSLNLVWSLRNQLQENSPTFDILSELEQTRKKFEKNANSFLKWRFRCRRHLRCWTQGSFRWRRRSNNMIIISINLYCANINVEKKIICALHKSYLQILFKKSTLKTKKNKKKNKKKKNDTFVVHVLILKILTQWLIIPKVLFTILLNNL